MKSRLAIISATALFALAACDSPPTEGNETAAAFPGSEAVEGEPAPIDSNGRAINPFPEETGDPAANPPPTLPPEDDPTSPASGATSPPER